VVKVRMLRMSRLMLVRVRHRTVDDDMVMLLLRPVLEEDEPQDHDHEDQHGGPGHDGYQYYGGPWLLHTHRPLDDGALMAGLVPGLGLDLVCSGLRIDVLNDRAVKQFRIGPVPEIDPIAGDADAIVRSRQIERRYLTGG
jgi:hypothetical protein